MGSFRRLFAGVHKGLCLVVGPATLVAILLYLAVLRSWFGSVFVSGLGSLFTAWLSRVSCGYLSSDYMVLTPPCAHCNQLHKECLSWDRFPLNRERASVPVSICLSLLLFRFLKKKSVPLLHLPCCCSVAASCRAIVFPLPVGRWLTKNSDRMQGFFEDLETDSQYLDMFVLLYIMHCIHM